MFEYYLHGYINYHRKVGTRYRVFLNESSVNWFCSKFSQINKNIFGCVINVTILNVVYCAVNYYYEMVRAEEYYTYVIIITIWLRLCLNISAHRIGHKNMLIKFVSKHFSLINMCVYGYEIDVNIGTQSTCKMETKV